MILGSAELFVKKGSDINLTCVTTVADEAAAAAVNNKEQQHQPLHFTWHHNGQVQGTFSSSYVIESADGKYFIGFLNS